MPLGPRLGQSGQNEIRETVKLAFIGCVGGIEGAPRIKTCVAPPANSTKIEALAVAIAGANPEPHLLQAARGVAEAEFELRNQREFRLALVEVEAVRISAATKVAADHQDGGDHATTDAARAFMLALPLLAKLDRYERKAWASYRRAIHIYAATER